MAPSFRPYRYSYSGADVKAYVYYPGMEDSIIPLESLHTVSVSIYEAKGVARALGFRNIRGKARATRLIAGSMILTVIEDHPLRPLVSQVNDLLNREPKGWDGWSIDRSLVGVGSAFSRFNFTNRLATVLPPFNLLLQYVSEGAQFQVHPGQKKSEPGGDAVSQNLTDIPGAAELLVGVEFIQEGKVTSVNDIVTEVTYSWIAEDILPMSLNVFHEQGQTGAYTQEQEHDIFMKNLMSLDNPDPYSQGLIDDNFENPDEARRRFGTVIGESFEGE